MQVVRQAQSCVCKALTSGLLQGSAKIFANFEKCTKTWKKFKNALIEEFGEAVDSYKIHQELLRRKKKPDESFQSYIYKMIELATQARVKTRATIQNIVAGIQDDPANKTILYGAKTIRELKE